MDKAIRILVANRPKLMRELLLATLSEQNWIEVVGEVTDSEAELVSVVAHLVNSGRVRLIGNFRGARIE